MPRPFVSEDEPSIDLSFQPLTFSTFHPFTFSTFHLFTFSSEASAAATTAAAPAASSAGTALSAATVKACRTSLFVAHEVEAVAERHHDVAVDGVGPCVAAVRSAQAAGDAGALAKDVVPLHAHRHVLLRKEVLAELCVPDEFVGVHRGIVVTATALLRDVATELHVPGRVDNHVAAIAEEVHRRGKVLIVDQAHGAHLKMFSDAYRTEKNCGTDRLLPAPAEECGADIVIDSTHKTMASFTQSAVVNIFGDRVDADEYEQALLTLESTSPSYILMYSLAVNAEIMAEHGNELAKKWRDDLDHFYSEIKKIDGVRVLTGQMVPGGLFDDTKIVLDLSRTGMSGKQAEAALIERGIYPEFSTGNIVMCLTGIGNVRADYDLLLDAARELWSAEK